ncbi:MAG: hypothetical protein H0X63_12185 [Flavobacteriales bacterium]|jgi:hypothetical protein|nr:hypothetical protein [Flavobacteriales bacterium]
MNFKHTLPLLLLICGSFLFSCNRENPEEKLAYLNGYWEIKKANLPNGETKTYSINMLIDFIEIEDGKGFRKKVAPQLDGSFQITEDTENIEVKIEDNQVILYYTTPFHYWKETVVEANEKQLVVRNEEDFLYTYNRFEKLNLE